MITSRVVPALLPAHIGVSQACNSPPSQDFAAPCPLTRLTTLTGRRCISRKVPCAHMVRKRQCDLLTTNSTPLGRLVTLIWPALT